MAVNVKVPSVGESVQEGMIASWRKASGDWVKRDEILLELETDKATVELAAEAEGRLQIIAQVGQVVKIGEVIGTIDEQAPRAGSAARDPQTASATLRPGDDAGAGAGAGRPTDDGPTEDGAPSFKVAAAGPAVQRMLAEQPIDTSKLTGSGRGGRLTKGDILTAGTSSVTSTPKAEPAPAKAPAPTPLGSERLEERKPMSMLRRRIAERLLTAQSSAAILTTFNEVDMTAILGLRKRYQDAFLERHGLKLGFMGFFLQASVAALKAFPSVNAYIEGNDLIYHNYCDIGVAVSTAKGLVVPIIRDTDKLNLAQIESAIAAYAQKARDNKISLEDLNGGTFTVSNGGIFGSLLSTPILNPPQSAILGMHKTQLRPVVMPDNSIQARPMMYLALSYDHRIIDGKEAVGFLVKIKEGLEDPSRLLLGV